MDKLKAFCLKYRCVRLDINCDNTDTWGILLVDDIHGYEDFRVGIDFDIQLELAITGYESFIKAI